MKHSFKFFSNKDCQFFPCHKGLKNFNCLFCFCPLFGKGFGVREDGSWYGDCKSTGIFQDCEHCNFPHKPQNYGIIINTLKGGERCQQKDLNKM